MNLTDLLKLYGNVQEHEPMSAHTTYKIGGTARWFIQPRSVTALMRIMQLLGHGISTYDIAVVTGKRTSGAGPGQ